MSESLIKLCEHNVWANEVLLDACEGLTDAQWDATAPGTFGSIRNTLMHIGGAQQRFVTAIAGAAVEETIERRPFPGLVELRENVRTSGESLVELAARAQPGATVTTTWRGEAFTLPAWLLINQAIIHATEHRTQVSAILTQQGIEVPGLDVWTFHEDRFNGDWSRLWSW